MKIRDLLQLQWPKNFPLQLMSRTPWAAQRATYSEAQPTIINAALERAQRRATGNWYVFAASRDVRRGRPLGVTIAGVGIVAWRDADGLLRVGPRTCPHLGADLATGVVHCGTLICRWHGLALDGNGREFGWKPLPGYDDGVLTWVRLDHVGGEASLDKPVVPTRPTGDTLHSVAHAVGMCEPADVIANRLDPWHGSWFHPYSFTRLEVLTTPTEDDDRFVVAVTFRVAGFGVPVIAEFTCPEARTITMRIIDGEGVGSVVETHATPTGLDEQGRPHTTVLEALIAHSDRAGFQQARRVAPAVTALMRYAAARLWRDDIAYAERLYQVRHRDTPG